MRILCLGATSNMAEAVCRRYAVDHCHFVLCARDENKLTAIKNDLLVRGAKIVDINVFDHSDTAVHHDRIANIFSQGAVDLVLVAQGILGEQKRAEEDFSEAERIIQSNYVAPVSLLTYISNALIRQSREATIAVWSSVAGDRGRQSNYIYGSAKGGLSVFLQGLRNRLQDHRIHVITIKPGLISTAMTAAIKKNLLFTNSEVAAYWIYRAIQKKKNVAYIPPFWAFILFIIRHIPEELFKRLKL